MQVQKSVQKLKLKRNLRVHLQGDISAGESLNKLLNIGLITLQTATWNSFLTFVTEVRGSSLESSTDCPICNSHSLNEDITVYFHTLAN